MSRISDKTLITTPSYLDSYVILDVSDTTDSPEGTLKRVSPAYVTGNTYIHADWYGASPTASAAINQSAIQAAMNALQTAGEGVIVLGPGEYTLSASGGAGTGPVFNWDVLDNWWIVGQGMGVTTLKLLAGDYSTGGDPHMFDISTCDNWGFANLTLDGNEPNHSAAQEQMHLVNMVDCNTVWFRNVEFVNAHGDGLKMLGNIVNQEKITILGCNFYNNKRAGLVVQRKNFYLTVANSIFDGGTNSTDQVVDYEPTGATSGAYHVWSGNQIIDTAAAEVGLSIGGIGTSDLLDRVVFVNNHLVNCPVRVWKTSRCLISGNTFNNSRDYAALDIRSANQRTKIIGNDIVQDGDANAISFNYQTSFAPSDVLLADNDIIFNGDSHAIQAENGVDGLRMHDNRLIGNATAKASGFYGVRIRNLIGTLGPIDIHDNEIRDFSTGVHFVSSGGASYKFESVQVHDNTFVDCTTGVYVEATGQADYESPLMLRGNVYHGVTTARNINNISYYQTGEMRYTILSGSPESVIAAPVGSYCARLDGAFGTTSYVKEAGGTTSSGWRALPLPTSVTVFNDTFTEASDTVLDSHTPDTDLPANGWTLSTASGWTAYATNDEAAQSVSGTQLAYSDMGQADCVISCSARLVSTSSFGGILLRYTDDNNYWAIVVNGSGTTFKILKRSAGTNSDAASTSVSVSGTVGISVIAKGNLISATIDGTTISVSDSHNASATTHGLYATIVARHYIDDFSVTV